MRSLAISLLTVLSIWLFESNILGFFPQKFVKKAEQLTPLAAHPLLEKYKQMESKFNVDLGHTYFAESKRSEQSLFDLYVWNSGNFENKLDVIIIGDSTQAWGLDTITVSKVSGLRVGQLSWESSVLNPISSAFFQQVVPCLLKKDGLIIISFTVAFLNADPADNRRWITEQDKLVNSGVNSCAELEDYTNRYKSNQRWQGGFTDNLLSYSGWQGNLEELSFVLEQRFPGTRYSIPFDFFSEPDSDEFEIEQLDEKVFSISSGTTITLTEAIKEIKFKSSLETIDFEQSYAQWQLLEDAEKTNIKINVGSMDPLDEDYRLCFAKPVAHKDEDSQRVGSWYDFSESDCMINFEALLMAYLGVDKILMHSSYHYGNETGQLMSMALGDFLRRDSWEPGPIILDRRSLDRD